MVDEIPINSICCLLNFPRSEVLCVVATIAAVDARLSDAPRNPKKARGGEGWK